MSFRRKVLSGIGWSAGSTALTMAVRLGQMLIVARLLAPSEIGLYALSNLVLGFVSIFADAGVTQGIIARRETDRNVLSSLFWTNTAMALVVSAILISAAPLVAHVYDAPRVVTPLTWISATFLAFALGQPFQALLQRELAFRSIAMAETVSTVLGAAISIVLTIQGRGVDGLVLGQIAYALIRSGLMCWAGSRFFIPSLHWRLPEAAASVKFGLFQVGDRMVGYFNTKLDQMLIGYFAGTAALGVYALAWSLVVDPVYRLNPIVTNVAFPVFAHQQNDRPALTRGFLGVTRALATVNAPILAGMAAVAATFVPLALGPRWHDAIPLMAILAWVGMVRSVGNPVGSLMMGVGRPDLSFRWSVLQSIVQLPVYALLLHELGLTRATLFLAAFMTLVVPVMYLFTVRRVLGPVWRNYQASFSAPVAAAIVMGLAVGMLGHDLASWPQGLALGLEIAAGLVIYPLVLLALRPGDLRAARTYLRRRGDPQAVSVPPAAPLPDTLATAIAGRLAAEAANDSYAKVSVVIPTYNRAHTLLRAIDSVLRQTYPASEIIIVDDGSSDGTLELLAAQPYARQLTVIRRQRGGGPAARNSGIRAATGKWVAFLDSDDAWHPDKLRRQISRLEQLGAEYGACYCGSVARDEMGGEQGMSRAVAEGEIYRDCLAFNVPGSTSCIVARRDLLLSIGCFTESLPSCQDWDLWLRLAGHCKFACVPEILTTLYVGRNDRITANAKARLRGHLYIYRQYIRPAARAGEADMSLFYSILGHIFMQIDRPQLARRCYTLYWQRKKVSPKRLFLLLTVMVGLPAGRFFAVNRWVERTEARMRPSPLRTALE